MKKTSILLLGFLAFFSACETDFDVNAPWKDITTVYGLLNQNDSVHSIKITKAFLVEGNALDTAQVPGYSQYDNNEIDVTIQQVGGTGNYTLNPIVITNKEEGVFYDQQQIVYQFFEPNLDENSDYKLIITNKNTGKVVTATTPIIDAFTIIKPTFMQPTISFYFNDEYKNLEAEWNTTKDGRRYQMTIRFNYGEKNTAPPFDSTAKYVDWVFSADKAINLKGGIKITKDISGEEFYEFLASKIAVNNNVERYAGNLDFVVDVAGEELNTYMDVNEPSTGIVQEKPDYTNIINDEDEDEVGIFSCRYKTQILSKPLLSDSKDWLQTPGSPTQGLGFK